MKRTFNKLITYICLIMLIFTFSGCSQFVDLGLSGDYEEVSISLKLQKQMIFCDTNQTFQGSQPINVSFEEQEDAQYLSPIEAAEKVKRSVVHIKVLRSNSVTSASGVIVDIKGGLAQNEYYVITCHHVVADGGEIIISVPDKNGKNVGDVGYDKKYVFNGYIDQGKEIDAQNAVCLVGGDRDGDIAVLKLKVGDRKDNDGNGISIVKATFPDKNQVSITYGEEVFAIGNPAGKLPMTYLHGYISYLDRVAKFESVGIMTNLIQHDCAITHGSSGGGLFNLKGQLIGITNGGIESQVGLSYAIPYYDSTEYGFMTIAEQLIESNNHVNYGYVEGRWDLGFEVADSGKSVSGTNIRISEIYPNSNAVGKLQEGDYITKIEFPDYEYPISSKDSFINAIFMARECLQTSGEIKFTVQRAK